jgi:glutamate synthase (NADH)
MFILRKVIENKVREELGLTDDDVFFASLSSRTLVYKGQLMPSQARTNSSLPCLAVACDTRPCC